MPEAAPPRGWRWLLLSAAVCALDLATKAWASAAFRLGEVREVTPFFNLVLWHNPGAAFSFLADAGGWQRWFFATLAVVVSVWLVFLIRASAPSARLYRLGLTLILGGAVGNLIDRLRLGYVIDFVELYYRSWSWPAFNVADSAITVGAGFFLLGTLGAAQTDDAVKG